MSFSRLDRVKDFLKDVWFSMWLKKTVPVEEETEFDRTLTLFSVFLFSIGVLSVSFYQEMPRIINSFGYMIFFPLVLAGIMCYITSMCYAEMVSLNANSGGCYRYAYYNLGEFVAFLAGWSVIFISITRFVFCTEYIMRVIDVAFLNGALSNSFHNYFPIGGFENYFLRVYQKMHLETVIPALFITGIGVIKLKYSKWLISLASVLNIIIVFICLTIFWFCMDLSKFNIISGNSDISFFTRGAVQGNMFYMEFEVALYCGQETMKPTYTVPKALVESCKWAFILYIASIILYSMRSAVEENDIINPMETALRKLGIEPFHVLPTVGLVLCNFICAFLRLYNVSRITYTMAKDGMLFSFLGITNRQTKIPTVGVLLMGGIGGVLAIFVGSSPSTQLASIAMANIVRILMLIAHLIMRYRHEYLINFQEQRARWLLFNYPRSIHLPTKTTQAISFRLIFLSLVTSVIALFISMDFIIRAQHPSNLFRAIFIIAMVVSLGSTYLLSLQPQNDRRLSYMVRGVPFTPILAILWYFLILILVPQSAWIKLVCWWLIGVIVYFSYACMRSNEYKSRKESESNADKSESTSGQPSSKSIIHS